MRLVGFISFVLVVLVELPIIVVLLVLKPPVLVVICPKGQLFSIKEIEAAVVVIPIVKLASILKLLNVEQALQEAVGRRSLRVRECTAAVLRPIAG